jgi:carbon monoxide dehydrogenase subunit G
MDLQGNVTLSAPPNVVWQALNNPQVLRVCIPGCEEITALSPSEMQARVVIKMGPVRATFVGKVSMTHIVPMQGYTLNFEGSGGSAGFAKGNSVITLSEAPEGTLLTYTAKASIAGKLGQIGGRMIDASARQLSEKFFTALKNHMAQGSPVSSDVRLVTATPSNHLTEHPPITPDLLALEKIRMLWFAAGVASTSIGVWLGAGLLK